MGTMASLGRRRRLGVTTLQLLRALENGSRYGFDLMDVTGLASGTVYPCLGRLERDGYVASSWESVDDAGDAGRPRRRYYVLTPRGRTAMHQALAKLDLSPSTVASTDDDGTADGLAAALEPADASR